MTVELGYVSLGRRRYAVERNAPSALSLARISQVAVNYSGRVHVLRRGRSPVIVYEPDGRSSDLMAWAKSRFAWDLD